MLGAVRARLEQTRPSTETEWSVRWRKQLIAEQENRSLLFAAMWTYLAFTHACRS